MPLPEYTRILLVDDDEDDRELFRLALSKVNKKMDLTEAPNGFECVRLLDAAAELPHFIFLDINMPRVDGIECLHIIRQRHPKELLPLVMLSTSGAPDVIARCMDAGANLYVQKPASLEELTRRIRGCMARHRYGVLEEHALLGL